MSDRRTIDRSRLRRSIAGGCCVNRFNLVMSLATMAFGMAFLIWILVVLFAKGFAALSPTLFPQTTPPPGSAGGLANAIAGSVVMVGVATLIARRSASSPASTSPSTAAAAGSRESTRFINDILLSAPSIVLGLFVYTVYVMQRRALLGMGRLGCARR